MMGNNNDYQYFDSDIEEGETSIDWLKYISALWKSRKQIVAVSLGFAVLSVVVALRQKHVYEATVVLAPEVQTVPRSNSLGSLASMFGVNLGGGGTSPDALNISLFPEIVSCTPFLTGLFEVELNYEPKDSVEGNATVFEEQESLPSVKLYDHLTGRDKEKSLLSKILENVFGPREEDPNYLKVDNTALTKEQGKVLKAMRTMISAEADKNTIMTTISVKMDDPLMCAQLADTVCRRLREYVIEYRTKKERINFEYYQALCDSAYINMVAAQAAYASSIDNDRSVVLHSVTVRRQRLEQEASIASQVYQQMVQQREVSRARLQEMKPVFAIVEPATKPLRAINSRKKICVVVTFFGFFVTCFWYGFLKDWLLENIPIIKERLNYIDSIEKK